VKLLLDPHLSLVCRRKRQVEPEHLDEQRKMLFTTEIPSIGSIAQAITEGMAAVGRDDAFEEYSVRLVWKQQ
jgi:PIN domain nuclease of toxin-antitoxin system